MKLPKTFFLLVVVSYTFASMPKLQDMIIFSSENPLEFYFGYNDSNMKTNGEYNVIRELISPDDIVFDVGANRGEWSLAVLSIVPTINKIYAFEPIPTIFNILKETMSNKPVVPHQLALSNSTGLKEFLYYPQNENVSELSSFYLRPILFTLLGITPESINVNCTTLDNFYFKQNIEHIDFLKIDTEGSELAVLKGARWLLKTQRIKHIQFEYGGTYSDAKITLKEVLTLLTHSNYTIFRVFDLGLIHIARWSDDLENYAYSNYVAITQKNAYPYTLIDNL